MCVCARLRARQTAQALQACKAGKAWPGVFYLGEGPGLSPHAAAHHLDGIVLEVVVVVVLVVVKN